jgi:carboxyl-terminal processing protease
VRKYSISQTQVVEEVWRVLNRLYLDPTFNHHDLGSVWRESMSRTIMTRVEAEAAIEAILRPLDDPLTRHLTAEELASTFDQFTGKSGGIGVTDPCLIKGQASGRFRILHVVAASPGCEGACCPLIRLRRLTANPP